jgi:hypothetical protein
MASQNFRTKQTSDRRFGFEQTSSYQSFEVHDPDFFPSEMNVTDGKPVDGSELQTALT